MKINILKHSERKEAPCLLRKKKKMHIVFSLLVSLNATSKKELGYIFFMIPKPFTRFF